MGVEPGIGMARDARLVNPQFFDPDTNCSAHDLSTTHSAQRCSMRAIAVARSQEDDPIAISDRTS